MVDKAESVPEEDIVGVEAATLPPTVIVPNLYEFVAAVAPYI